MPSARPRIGAVVLAVALCYLGAGILLPLVSVYIVRDAAAGGLEVGLVLGAYPFGMLSGRLLAGWTTDTLGRARTLRYGVAACMIGSSLIVVPTSAAALVPIRLLHGFGQALVAVAAVTWLMDVSAPARRAQVLALLGTGQWGGFALGTMVGGLIGSIRLAAIAAGVAAACALICVSRVKSTPSGAPRSEPYQLFPRESILPGVTLGLTALGYAAMTGFVVPALDARGANGKVALVVFSASVLVARFVALPVASRIGLMKSLPPVLILLAGGLGLLAMARNTAVASLGGLMVGTGQSLVWPTLGALVATKVTTDRRGAAIASLSAFFDITAGLSSLLFGIVLVHYSGFAVFSLAAVGVLVAVAPAVMLVKRESGLAIEQAAHDELGFEP